jgi:hypothetical protein
MRKIVVTIMFAAAPLLSAAPTLQSAKQAEVDGTEDRAVLTAVINHTVRPEVQRLTHLGPAAVLFLIDHTTTICESVRSPRSQPFCIGANAAEWLREGQTAGIASMAVGPIPAEAIPSAAHRAELIASLKERNTDRHVLPLSEGVDVKLVETPPVTKTPSGGTSTSYTVFSLPGYSSAGQAVVSAFYDCGGRCGTSWLWLLEKRGADWHVRARYVVGTF